MAITRKTDFDGAYYQDENGNSSCVAWFESEQKAKEALESLDGCVGCNNCLNCTNCVDCIECTNCLDCIECVGCLDGFGFQELNNCEGSKGVANDRS